MGKENMYYPRFIPFCSSCIAGFTKKTKYWVRYTSHVITPGNSMDAEEAAASRKLQTFPQQL